MLKMLDGPARGVVLCCARAPLFLRVVHDPGYEAAVCKKGRAEWDALDQLDDRPAAGEVVHVYFKAADHGSVHYDGRDRNGRRFGRWEQVADYQYHGRQPDDAVLRDNRLWADWCLAEAAGLGYAVGEKRADGQVLVSRPRQGTTAGGREGGATEVVEERS